MKKKKGGFFVPSAAGGAEGIQKITKPDKKEKQSKGNPQKNPAGKK